MNRIANKMPTTKANAANTYQADDQPAISSLKLVLPRVKWLTTAWAQNEPMVAPRPLVIIMNTPCALLRIFSSVFWSTKSEPLMLKKSKATP